MISSVVGSADRTGLNAIRSMSSAAMITTTNVTRSITGTAVEARRTKAYPAIMSSSP